MDEMKASPKPVTHVIFDMDGLLLDTESLYTKALSTLAAKYGKQYTWDIKVKAMGKTSNESAEIIIKELGLPITIKEYKEVLDEEYKILFPDSQLMPGVDRLLWHLHKHNVPIAVATSSNKFSYDLKTQKHQKFFDMFHHVVLGSSDPSVKYGKPHPDIFLVCCSRFDNPPPPHKVLVFEDAPLGMDAALAAGMQVVFIPDPRVDQQTCERATVVLKSMADFKPEMFGLPAFG